jgi:hypothetical protein
LGFNFVRFSEFLGLGWLGIGGFARIDPLVIDVDRLRQEVDGCLKIKIFSNCFIMQIFKVIKVIKVKKLNVA